jgi:Insertion element 4 transposase N-terminal
VESSAEPVSLIDQLSLGVLTTWVSRDAVEVAIGEHGKQPRRRGGTLPAHVMMYFVVAMALFADLDYEAVLRKLVGPLRLWRSWDPSWTLPTSGGITQARQRLGFEPVKTLFERIAVPVASRLTLDAFCARRRLVSLDGMVFDLPDTEENTEEFGKPSGGVYPQARVVTLVECGSHVSLGARIGPVVGKGTGERSAAVGLIGLLEPGMMLICDQGFYSFALWCQAADTGADLLWRLGDIMDLPIVERLGDGSFVTLLFAPGVTSVARRALLVRAKAGEKLDPTRVRFARVVEYNIADRGSGDLICLLTTIVDPREAASLVLAGCYHQRWEHEGANREVKTQLRGPGKILRSKTPDMVRQEIYGYLIAHYAVSAMICRAATETGIDPDRVKFTQTVRLARDTIAGPDGFFP